jgi:hypothetical protein
MAAKLTIKMIAELTGLGEGAAILDSYEASVPTKYNHQYRVQAVADTEEAIDIGDITTVELVVIKVIANDADIDCNFSAAFKASITIDEGKLSAFKPAGTVYLKNNDAAEQVTFEVWIFGT